MSSLLLLQSYCHERVPQRLHVSNVPIYSTLLITEVTQFQRSAVYTAVCPFHPDNLPRGCGKGHLMARSGQACGQPHGTTFLSLAAPYPDDIVLPSGRRPRAS